MPNASNPFPLKTLLSVPNLLTLLNLGSGAMAVGCVFNFHLDLVPWFVAVSLFADFLDGFAARKLNIASPIGKELDSLADVVSFGVLPGSIVYQMLWQYFQISGRDDLWLMVFSAPAFLLTLAAALRLAKFNLDERQSDGFRGLPTPAMGLFVVSMLLAFLHNIHGWSTWLYRPEWLYTVVLVFSLLMLSEIPMLSFKFKNIAFRQNLWRYAFLITVVLMLLFFQFTGLFFCIPLYILFSILNNLIPS